METRPPPAPIGFVGREHEMAVLLNRLDEAKAGRGGVVLLAGEPGIGKTRTAEELAGIAEARGIAALWGRCFEGEGAPAYWPWLQVMRAYIRDCDPETLRAQLGAGAPVVAQLIPDLHDLLERQPPPPDLDAAQARFQLFDSVTTFLRNAARARPLLIALDDLHWADTPSLLLLQFVARDLRDAPLLLVGAFRDFEVSRGRPLARALGELGRVPGGERLALAGLPEAEVARLIEAVTAIPTSAALVSAVTAETEGNPFFVTEVVRVLAADGRLAAAQDNAESVAPLALPRTVREVIGRRLENLSDACDTALTIAAVIGREFQFRVLESVARSLNRADLEGEGALDALEEAEERGVVSGVPARPGLYRFTHVLFRETLYEELPSTRRMRLHRHVGDALEGLYGHDLAPHMAELASHFVQAASTRDAAKAVRYECWAGDHAASIFAYEDAAVHYTRALEVLDSTGGGGAEDRCDLLLSLAEAHGMAGDVAAAQQCWLDAAALARAKQEPVRLARAALGYAGGYAEIGRVDATVVRLLEEALTGLPVTDDPRRARLLARLAIELYYTEQRPRSLACGHEAIAMARRLDDPQTLAHVLRFDMLTRAANVEQRLAIGDEIVQLATVSRNLSLELAGQIWRFTCLMELGEAAEADRTLAAFCAVADRLRQPLFLSQAAAFRTMRSLMDGRTAEAELLAQQALALGLQAGRMDAWQAFRPQLFILRAQQGRLAELEEATRALIIQFPAIPSWRCALAYLYSELDRHEDAAALWEQLAANDFADIPEDTLWLTAITAAAECCAFLKDAGRARALYDLLRPHAGRNAVIGGGYVCTGSVARSLGLLAATMQRWHDAEAQFEAALTMNARLGTRPWLAQTLQDYAAMLAERFAPGDVEHAIGLATEALATARELGMARLEQRAVALLARLAEAAAAAAGSAADPSRAPVYPDGLSQREVEVLRLVARGASNRAIAGELVLSVRTVETHVASVYRKIGARNRAEAVAYALRHGLC